MDLGLTTGVPWGAHIYGWVRAATYKNNFLRKAKAKIDALPIFIISNSGARNNIWHNSWSFNRNNKQPLREERAALNHDALRTFLHAINMHRVINDERQKANCYKLIAQDIPARYIYGWVRAATYKSVPYGNVAHRTMPSQRCSAFGFAATASAECAFDFHEIRYSQASQSPIFANRRHD